MNYWRYTGVLIGAGVAMAGVLAGLEALTGSVLSSSGSGVVPPMVAALVEGQRYAKTHRALPDNRSAWRFAMVATIINLCWSCLVLGAIAWLDPEFALSLRTLIDPEVRGVVLGLGVFVIGAILLASRYFLTMGARGIIKAQAKRDGAT